MNKAHDVGLRRTQGHAEQEGYGREHVEIVKYRKECVGGRSERKGTGNGLPFGEMSGDDRHKKPNKERCCGKDP